MSFEVRFAEWSGVGVEREDGAEFVWVESKSHIFQDVDKRLQVISDFRWFLRVQQGERRQERPRALRKSQS